MKQITEIKLPIVFALPFLMVALIGTVMPPVFADHDGDTIDDAVDNCPDVANEDQADTDGDGVGDACEPDSDGDGVIDDFDVCPGIDDIINSDFDGLPDGCEPDSDGDGVIDDFDACPGFDDTAD